MKYILQLLNAAVDNGEFDQLVNELTALIYNAATSFPEQGGLPVVGERSVSGIVPDNWLVIPDVSTLRQTIRAALDGAL